MEVMNPFRSQMLMLSDYKQHQPDPILIAAVLAEAGSDHPNEGMSDEVKRPERYWGINTCCIAH